METYLFGTESAPNVLIQPVDSHDLEGIENEVKTIRELTDTGFRMIAVRVPDWNRDLSPWTAPAVFGKEGFGDGAGDFLEEILPLCPDGKACYIGGYSLAGLFALWAAYRTGRFAGVAAASPSVWFPGFHSRVQGIPCAFRIPSASRIRLPTAAITGFFAFSSRSPRLR